MRKDSSSVDFFCCCIPYLTLFSYQHFSLQTVPLFPKCFLFLSLKIRPKVEGSNAQANEDHSQKIIHGSSLNYLMRKRQYDPNECSL
jgi:hypothetical protein